MIIPKDSAECRQTIYYSPRAGQSGNGTGYKPVEYYNYVPVVLHGNETAETISYAPDVIILIWYSYIYSKSRSFWCYIFHTFCSALADLLQKYSCNLRNMSGATEILVCLLALLAPLRVTGQSRCTSLGVSVEFVAPSDSGHMLVTNISSVANKTAFCHVNCLTQNDIDLYFNGTNVSALRNIALDIAIAT